MKICTKCGDEKPLTGFNNVKSRGDMPQSWCMVCERVRQSEWRAKNPKKIKTKNARWYKDNPEKSAARGVKYRKENPEKLASTRAAGKAGMSIAVAAWQKANPGKVRATTARYRAAKLNATPAWANQFFIDEIYDLAQRRTKATGFEWQVDHYYPLRSNWVCGLHTELNLRVIPASLNQSKGNRRVCEA